MPLVAGKLPDELDLVSVATHDDPSVDPQLEFNLIPAPAHAVADGQHGGGLITSESDLLLPQPIKKTNDQDEVAFVRIHSLFLISPNCRLL